MKQFFYLSIFMVYLTSCQLSNSNQAIARQSVDTSKTAEKSDILPLPSTPADTLKPEPKPVNPPKEIPQKSVKNIDFDTTQWTEVTDLDASILLDLRYATTNNFMEEQVYECGRCFLRPAVAEAIVNAHRELQQKGLGLKMYDCYRPRPIQWKLWNKVPNPKYVADPRKGSMHNRGSAVDLTIVDDKGRELDMGTDYDYFGKEGWTFYEGSSQKVLDNRKLLRETLAKFGLKHIKTEWWHFAYRGRSYAISDFVWECE